MQERTLRWKSTSKLICSRGTYSPAIVPTKKYNRNLPNSCKIQSSMEISLKLLVVEITSNQKPQSVNCLPDCYIFNENEIIKFFIVLGKDVCSIVMQNEVEEIFLKLYCLG